MRKVFLNQLTPDMRLARPVFFENMLMLNRGIGDLNKYAKTLDKKGIYTLYIEDSISHEIHIEDIISEKTICKCRLALQNVYDTMQKTGTVDSSGLLESSTKILEELMTRKDLLISLESIGTTDTNTLSHSLNVAIYSLVMGTKLDLPKDRLILLSESAMMHDIGKTLLDQETLFKAGHLSETEFTHIKSHTQLGYEILKENHLMSAITKNVALYHHERIDGSGYPDGKYDSDIHTFARIVAIADVYDALTMDRCYRKAVSAKEAVSILKSEAGSKLDADLVNLFISQLAIYPNGTLVNLSDGRSGIVSYQNPSMPHHPVVRIIPDTDNLDPEFYEVDLAQEKDLSIIN